MRNPNNLIDFYLAELCIDKVILKTRITNRNKKENRLGGKNKNIALCIIFIIESKRDIKYRTFTHFQYILFDN